MTEFSLEALQTADWVLAALTAFFAMMGLFRGFSGTIAFVLACAAAAFSVLPGWTLTALASDSLWMRRAICFVGVLLVFGIVRWLVKKLVNGILSQPSDAIFGFLLGVATGIGVVFAWAFSGIYTEFSTFVTIASSLM